MTSKERISASWNGTQSDHVPLTTWCFGLPAPARLQWSRNGQDVKFWFSKRMEHIHTLVQPWELEDDFNRVLAWHSLGVDDVLDVSVPWSMDPSVTYKDWRVPTADGERYPFLNREYETPSGKLLHSVSETGEETAEGWVVQPPHVPLIEDFNIPRAVKHAVADAHDVAAIQHLYKGPDAEATAWFDSLMKKVSDFAVKNGVPVQAWSAFGMDGVIWLTGVEGAILMAMDDPEAFGRLIDIVTKADYGRTELAAKSDGVDMVVQRGWYSSTEFWSPNLFDTFVYPHLEALTALAHKHGKKFGYVMTTGITTLGPRLADAGVDGLYFVDPVQDDITLEQALDCIGGRMTIVGGTNALTVGSRDKKRIDEEVKRAIDVLGPTNRFILHPVDALFPDTPWEGVELLIEAWQKYR